MADRIQEKEARRAAREAAEKKKRRKEKRRTIIAYAVAGVLAGAILVGAVIAIAGGNDDNPPGHLPDGESTEPMPDNAFINVLTGSVNDTPGDGRTGSELPPVEQADLEKAAEAANCELQLDLEDEGNTHLEETAPDPAYETNPPNSGDHILPPLQQADGAYLEFPGNKYVVHALEHGRIAIQYSPDLPEEDQLLLKGLFEDDPAGMLLFPNPSMDEGTQVAAAAWTQLITCDSFEGGATIDALRAFRDVYRGQGPEQVPIYIQE